MQTDEGEFSHRSVLLDEILRIIDVRSRSKIVDATLGLGGHSEATLEATPDVVVVGIAQDDEAVERAAAGLAVFGTRLRAVHGNFAKIREIVEGMNFGRPHAIIADLGVSSLQLDDANRG